MRLQLLRVEKSDECVRGVLMIEGEPFCATLECPDEGNKPWVSCIPVGQYPLKLRKVSASKSAGLGWGYEVLGVPSRTDILIHVGNIADDTSGCVLVGERFGKLNGYRAVLSSADAFERLIDKMETHSLGSSLSISECVIS